MENMENEVKITPEILDIIHKSVQNSVEKAIEKITLRLSQEQEEKFIESLVSISLGRLIQIGTEIGTETGIKSYQQAKEESIRKRYERRFHNTKLLLQEYRKLKQHVTDSIYKKSSTVEALEILEDLDQYQEDELFIDAIKKSKDRTSIIIAHVEKMLDMYKHLCDKHDERYKEFNTRKWKVIYHYYISLDEEKNISELTEMLNCGRTCIYNDIDDAARSLTTLIFGIDSINLKYNIPAWKK